MTTEAKGTTCFFQKYTLVFLVSIFLMSNLSFAQESIVYESTVDHSKKMQWFKNAKLGIFIVWGIYAVNGIDESWSFFNEYISHDNYLKQTEGFTASKYDPQSWADLIKQSGAKYSVITAKHHDGFALWDTKFGELNAPKSSTAKKDVLTPFVNSLRNNDLKVGIYYSLPDWSYMDYPGFTRNKNRYEIAEEPNRWKKFLNYYQGQLKELSGKYNPDLYWFDGDWEHSAEEWQAREVRQMLLEVNPNVIINNRLTGHGDYATPEQGMPVIKPKEDYWELCMTMNDSWGYQGNDKNYKTTNQVIGIFTDVISNGGNLLLDIGPKADGSIPKEQIDILEELGEWTGKHQEAIFGTLAGIPPEHFYGPTTLSKDKSTLYLFVKGNPGGEIVLRGLKNKINRIYVVGDGTKLRHKVVGKVFWNAYPGIKYIEVPDYVLDDRMTVIAVMLDGKVDLYREAGSVIESN